MDTEIVKEDLRKWFKDGGWNRYNTKGEKVGKCARDDKDGDGKADGPKPKCLPASKAASLGKKKVAAAVKRKRAEDPNPDRKGAAKNVSTESVVHEMISTSMSGRKYKSIDNPEDQARLKKEDDRKKAAKDRAGKARKAELAATRQTKGIKFYDAKGSGYMKDGKKVYEGADLEQIKEFVGTTIAGTVGAATAKKKDRVRKAVGTGAGYAVGSTIGRGVGAGAAGGVPVIGGLLKGAGGAAGSVAGGVGGAVLGNKLAGETKKKKKKKTNEETELAEAPAAPPKKPLRDTGNWVQNQWNKFVPPPESSNNPNVRSGLRKPGSLEKPALDAMNKTAETINKPIKAAGQATKGLRQAGDWISKNPLKAGAIGAGVVGAGALAGAALAGGKKKKQNEEVSYKDFMRECWKTHKKVGMKMKGGKLVNDCRPKNEEVQVEGAAWTKKEGKNESGGLNEKGRKSYERENPGSDLKRPSKKVGNKRRASFCARMKGMRKRQKPSNNTGEDRLSKSLRAWNC